MSVQECSSICTTSFCGHFVICTVVLSFSTELKHWIALIDNATLTQGAIFYFLYCVLKILALVMEVTKFFILKETCLHILVRKGLPVGAHGNQNLFEKCLYKKK